MHAGKRESPSNRRQRLLDKSSIRPVPDARDSLYGDYHSKPSRPAAGARHGGQTSGSGLHQQAHQWAPGQDADDQTDLPAPTQADVHEIKEVRRQRGDGTMAEVEYPRGLVGQYETGGSQAVNGTSHNSAHDEG